MLPRPARLVQCPARGRDIIGRSDAEAQEHKLLNRPTRVQKVDLYQRNPFRSGSPLSSEKPSATQAADQMTRIYITHCSAKKDERCGETGEDDFVQHLTGADLRAEPHGFACPSICVAEQEIPDLGLHDRSMPRMRRSRRGRATHWHYCGATRVAIR